MIMRNQVKSPQRRSAAPLPVPVTPRDLQELREEAATLDADLHALARVIIDIRRDGDITDDEVALVRRIGSNIDAFRSQWRSINHPASDDEISAELGILAQLVPTAGNINLTLFAQGLSANAAELKPSLFVLLRGSHAVQSQHQFLSIAVVAKEIKKAERAARRHSYALKEFRLDEFEADLQRERERCEARALEWRAERKRQKIAEHRRRKADRAEEEFWRKWLDAEDKNDGEISDNGTSS
jgi:hypothetical protein